MNYDACCFELRILELEGKAQPGPVTRVLLTKPRALILDDKQRRKIAQRNHIPNPGAKPPLQGGSGPFYSDEVKILFMEHFTKRAVRVTVANVDLGSSSFILIGPYKRQYNIHRHDRLYYTS